MPQFLDSEGTRRYAHRSSMLLHEHGQSGQAFSATEALQKVLRSAPVVGVQYEGIPNLLQARLGVVSEVQAVRPPEEIHRFTRNELFLRLLRIELSPSSLCAVNPLQLRLYRRGDAFVGSRLRSTHEHTTIALDIEPEGPAV